MDRLTPPMRIAVDIFPTDKTINPIEFARAAEDLGYTRRLLVVTSSVCVREPADQVAVHPYRGIGQGRIDPAEQRRIVRAVTRSRGAVVDGVDRTRDPARLWRSPQ